MQELITLFKNSKNTPYIEEPISQYEHGLQAAFEAYDNGEEHCVIIAALFHDIGHLLSAEQMGNLGTLNHEELGANYLSKYFDENVTNLVRKHVLAKRYLVTRYPEYLDTLSSASKETFLIQGGKMTEREAVLFENDKDFEKLIRLRGYDDCAKIYPHPLNIPEIDFFLNLTN